MKQLLLLITIIGTLVSCQYSKQNKDTNKATEKQDKFELVQIQFGPCFISASILTANFSTNKILFQRIGESEKFIYAPPEYGLDKKEIFSPKTSYFTIDSLSSIYIQDSLLEKFEDSDFQNMSKGTIDGIWNSIIITNNENIVRDFELDNDYTPRQLQLITHLLEICIKQETDSLNLEYLKDLRGYYK